MPRSAQILVKLSSIEIIYMSEVYLSVRERERETKLTEETMTNKKKNDGSKKKERHIVTWSQEFGRCLGMMIATGTLVFTLDTYHPELVPETLNAFSTDMEAGGGGKPDAALVMDWSVEEHYVLENGLAKLKDEPKISKYVKIAAALPEKTVRDVAMRCSWMTASALIKSISSAPTLTKLTQSASRNSF